MRVRKMVGIIYRPIVTQPRLVYERRGRFELQFVLGENAKKKRSRRIKRTQVKVKISISNVEK